MVLLLLIGGSFILKLKEILTVNDFLIFYLIFIGLIIQAILTPVILNLLKDTFLVPNGGISTSIACVPISLESVVVGQQV